MTAKIADLSKMFFIRERMLHYCKASEYKKAYRIIDNKMDDDHRSYAANPIAHAL
jgi:hypothetical protein